MNNLLEKFSNITISSTDRISDVDKTECEKLQADYEQDIKLSEKHHEALQLLYNELPSTGGYLTHILRDTFRDRLLENYKELQKEHFIRDVSRYFNDKYSLSIKSDDIVTYFKRREEISIRQSKEWLEVENYNQVVDCIFKHIGGRSFAEQEDKQHKDKFINFAESRDIKPSVKGKKVILSIGYSGFNPYNVTDRVEILLRVLANFDGDGYSLNNRFIHNIARDCSILSNKGHDDFFKKHELNNNKILFVQFYKNGKVELTFSNNELALQFGKEYLRI